jgi:PAS domain S-box-containing protein
MNNTGHLNEERERAILDSVNEGVFTVDLEWKLTSFNRGAEKITGITRDEAIGRPCYEVLRANICEKECAIQRTITSGKPVVNATAYIINRGGKRIPVRLSTALVKDAGGNVVDGVETFQDLTQIEELQKELEGKYTLEDIIGRSPVMKKIFAILPQIAQSSSTVLIHGESGTGKELFARAIHSLSGRKGERFVPVNCAALPDTLLESELFGHKAGAFTDAKRDKPGRFTLADGGTIFLDEIGDVSPAMQVRLLRVLQDQMIEPLGSIEPTPVDVRVIAATNRDLRELISQGRFREDLYYRIRIIQLDLPRLRERREDIPLLLDHLINKFNIRFGKNIAGVSDDVMKILMEYNYPGNVRELENIIEHAFILCRGGLIEVHHLPMEMRGIPQDTRSGIMNITLREMEIYMIREALHRHNGSRKKTAEQLGIDLSTLYRKMKKFDIEARD